MAVAFDAVGPSASGTTGAASPLTWTHVCGASATHLLVGATWDGSPDSGQSMSATYNGVAMTPLPGGPWHTGSGTAGFLQVWSLASPPSGSHTVSVTATGTPGGLNGGSISFTGSATLSAVQTFVPSGNATNPSLAFTGSIAGNMVAAFAGGGSPMTASGTWTSRYNEVSGSGQQGAGYTACSTIASPGGTTAAASWTAASDFYAVAAVEVQAGAAAPAAFPIRPYRTKLPRGYQPQRRRLITVPLPPQTFQAAVSLSGSGSLTAVPVPCITGLGGNGAGYFTDQRGNPRMVLGDAVWGLPGNVGRWSSGAWAADYDTYFATRGGQGFTVAYCKPMGTVQSGNIDNNGGTFDGLFPFQGGAGANPSTGLTSSYWARIDYMLASAASQGITVFLNAIGYDSDFTTAGPLAGKSAAEFQSYGAQLGARYASQPNLIWMVADDYFGGSDTLISGFLTGLRGAGDTHPITIENYPETTSRFDLSSGSSLPWGAANGQFNWCYSYNVTYYGVEKAFLEASQLTPIQGDGYFYQGGSSYAGGSGAFAFDRAVRQDAWMALSSGARGIILGDEACWQWQSGAQAAATNNWYQKNNAGHIRALMESLPGWQLLIPDTSSLLVTAGRGTHASGFSSGGGGGQYEVSFSDSYVTASRTPSGDLAVIYLSHATSITVDQSQMAAGYAAYWADPITGAKTSTTAGSSYNSATPGNNSQGDPDWVLVLQAATATAGSASLSGTGSLTAGPQLAATATLSGTGTLTAAPALAATTALSGAGTLTASPQSSIAATAGLSGLGSLSVSGEIIGTAAALSGAGTLTAAPQLPGTASLSGAGTLSAAGAFTGSASLSGTGTLTAAPQLLAAFTLAGLGTLAVPGVTLGTVAALTGTGTLTAPWQLQPATALTGAGTLTAGAVLTGAGGLSGLGTLTAGPQFAASATLSGSGTLSASPAAPASVNLSGLGSLTASPSLTGTASLSGSGSLTASPQLPASAALSGTGTLSAAPTAAGTATLSGSGTLTAAWALSPAVGLSGTGTLSYAQGQAAATLTGSGSLTASPVLTGAAALSGTGTLAAAGVLVLAAMASLAGQGTLTAVLQMGSTAVVSGTGVLTAQAQRPGTGSQAMFMAALGDA